MRRPERIPIFLKLVDWLKLSERWNLEKSLAYMPRIARTYWIQNSDQRVGQVLINLNLIPDSLQRWNDEEEWILRDQGIDPREFTFWGNNYDKDMNQLSKTKWNLIKDMSIEHIQAILNGNWARGSMKDLFEIELAYRKNHDY
jgi:hypothetical protein